jgi:hypothetical protein
MHVPAAPVWWSCKGVCASRGKDGIGCSVFCRLTVGDRPADKHDIIISVQIFGKCSHLATDSDDQVIFLRTNERQLAGNRRLAMGKKIIREKYTATDVYYRGLAEISQDKLKAGNTSDHPKPHKIRQAAYEVRKSERPDDNVYLSLNVLRKAWMASEDSTVVKGYIQLLGMYPFCVMFYTEQQIRRYCDLCQDANSSTLFFDSTGSVIRRFNDSTEKVPYFYTMLMNDEQNIPAFEFLTTKHTGEWIASFVKYFLRSVRDYAHDAIKPKRVITDFSYAMMNATLDGFNSMTLISYLGFAFQMLNANTTSEQASNTTLLFLCGAHMMKAMSMKLTRRNVDKSKRKVTLVFYASLQYSASLLQAGKIYADVYNVLCSRADSDEVQASYRRLYNVADEVNTYEDACDSETNCENQPDEDVINEAGGSKTNIRSRHRLLHTSITFAAL